MKIWLIYTSENHTFITGIQDWDMFCTNTVTEAIAMIHLMSP